MTQWHERVFARHSLAATRHVLASGLLPITCSLIVSTASEAGRCAMTCRPKPNLYVCMVVTCNDLERLLNSVAT